MTAMMANVVRRSIRPPLVEVTAAQRTRAGL